MKLKHQLLICMGVTGLATIISYFMYLSTEIGWHLLFLLMLTCATIGIGIAAIIAYVADVEKDDD